MRNYHAFLTLVFTTSIGISQNSSANSSEKALIDGKKIFETNCVACHGKDGDGKGPAAVAIPTRKPRNFVQDAFQYGSTDTELFKTISKGIKGSAMPAWSPQLSDVDIQAVIQHVKTFKKSKK